MARVDDAENFAVPLAFRKWPAINMSSWFVHGDDVDE
jgi:hypothetical protein